MVIKLITSPDFFPEAVQRLKEHGCDVELSVTYGVVTLPEGSSRSMVPFRTYYERYDIVLPDGYYMREVLDRDGRSSLFYLKG